MVDKTLVETFAPEIIYLQDGNPDDPDDAPLPSEHYDDQVTWCEDSINERDTKYIRADLADAHIAELEAQLSTCETKLKQANLKIENLEWKLEDITLW